VHDAAPDALGAGEVRVREGLAKGASRGTWSAQEAATARERLNLARRLLPRRQRQGQGRAPRAEDQSGTTEQLLFQPVLSLGGPFTSKLGHRSYCTLLLRAVYAKGS
jgi:hypothetical protein